MEQIPVDLITSEPSVQAGVSAMERIHGRHLAEMTPEEQGHARDHWRAQVEQILFAVRDVHAGADGQIGRAVLTFLDVGEDQVDVGVALEPEPRELPNGELEVTPAQLMALSALEAVTGDEDGFEE
jgi:hypothetical protein